MMDILYLDDYINLYSYKHKKIIIVNPYKDTLRKGHVINKEKFIKKMEQVINEYHINKNIFNNNINVIINNSYSSIDKEILKEILEILNYKKINFIQEINYLDLDKKKLYINFNNRFFYIYNIDNQGKVKINYYDNNEINNLLITKIIKLYKKEKIYILGKNYIELVKLLKKEKIDYYFFEDSNNLFIKIILNNM